MEATLPIIRELAKVGDSLMWIVGPGHMVSENTSHGIREPEQEGDQITIAADNWRFHLDTGLVAGIQFVETYGDLTSHYVRFSDPEGETLLRAYFPRKTEQQARGQPPEGNHDFDEMRGRYVGIPGIEHVRREIRSTSPG